MQCRVLLNLQPDIEEIVLNIHGISPRNRPLGQRQVIWRIEDIKDLTWIEMMARLWPFSQSGYRIGFIEEMTRDLHDMRDPRFHFVVSYGHHDGVSILIHQQIGVVENMPGQAMMVDEFWAANVPVDVVSHSLPGIALGAPFWFRFARQQHIYPHLFVDGRRAREVDRHWNFGDVILARFLVWQRHHALTMMLNEGEERDYEDVEMTSWLQTDVRMSGVASLQQKSKVFADQDSASANSCEVFSEICAHLQKSACPTKDDGTDGRANLDPCLPNVLEIGFGKETNEWVAPDNNTDFGNQITKSDWSQDSRVQELQRHIETISKNEWKGLNRDFHAIPDLHPFAQHACNVTKAISPLCTPNIFHIFTDGSAKGGEAAWAFVLLCEQKIGSATRYFRIGYAAGILCDDVGPYEASSQDAEATALIAAAEFLLSRSQLANVDVFLHFDALAVGQGSLGKTKVIEQDSSVSCRQKAARIMLSLIQRKAKSLFGLHTHAHEGQPWNECADSIATVVRKGWVPPHIAVLNAGAVVTHQLAEWAWLLIAPTCELPHLHQILANEAPDKDFGSIDSTLGGTQRRSAKKLRSGTLKLATVNVGTLLQNQQMPGTTISCKMHELLEQFRAKKYHVIAVQESRARTSRLTQHGPFTCLAAAADHGIGGVELWVNIEEVCNTLGVCVDPMTDFCVWHSSIESLR
jgi:ribonuclease HI